jgi:hypothetical protein
MIKRVHGIVHGKTIQIEEDIGFSDGRKANPVIEAYQSSPEKRIEELLRCAGALAVEWTDDDKIFDEIY